MTSLSPKPEAIVRPVQYGDLSRVDQLLVASESPSHPCSFADGDQRQSSLRQWSGLLKLLRPFPHQFSHLLHSYVWEQADQISGVIQVSPFNQSRSTWRIDHVTADSALGTQEIGTQLLRYCLETIWEARMWMVEIDIHHTDALGLYRHNGFQPLAQVTYWSLVPQQLKVLAEHEPVLPNFLPVNNADAALLYQLDTAAMPPLVRQVFDRHIPDFKTNLIDTLLTSLRNQAHQTDRVRSYVFEPQRKAAIGYFDLCRCTQGTQPHHARLTVHPAYTWLYPELLSHMARLTQTVPPADLHLSSADYQPEREEYLEQIGAERIEQTLMMSRSVWHKLRESRSLSLETLQLPEVLKGLQPNRTPVPGRMSFGLHQEKSLSPQPPTARSSRDRRLFDPILPQVELGEGADLPNSQSPS